MKLSYITNVKIPAADAQSIQVAAMANVFSSKLEGAFILISPQTKENKKINLGFDWHKIEIASRLPRFLRYLILIAKSLKIIRKDKPDFIYSRDVGVVFVYTLFGYKAIYEIHKPFETWIGNFLFKILGGRVRLVAISQALKDFVLDKYKIKESNVLVAHDGVFLEKYTQLDKNQCREQLLEELNLKQDSFLVIYSSNLYPGKGLELVVKAAQKMPNTYFVVMGRKDSTEIKSEDFPQNLIYLGRKEPEKIPGLLKGADVLIMPFTKKLKTWKYHSALKIFEYMAAEVPVVSSNIGSLNEIFNNTNTFLFDPENIEDFVAKLNLVKGNPKMAQERTNQARKDVEKYTWEKRANKILDFIDFKNN